MAQDGFSDGLLVSMANVARTQITHLQAHSADPGAAGATAAIGARQACAWNAASADGDFDLATPVTFTGLGANTAVWGVSFWSASSGGTCLGDARRAAADDANANAAGEYTITEITVGGSSDDTNG